MSEHSAIDVSGLLADIVKAAYDHHKTHARFQELQRRWLSLIFLTVSGGIFYSLSNVYELLDHETLEPTPLFWSALIVHAVIAALISLATTKHSGEFQRHFIRGDQIIDAVRDVYVESIVVGGEKPSISQIVKFNGLFDTLKLETSAQWYEERKRDNRWFINLSKVWSASRLAIYLYSGVIAAELSFAAHFLAPKSGGISIQNYVLSAVVFIIVFRTWSILLINYLQHIARATGAVVSDRDISPKQAQAMGVSTRHERMQNDEIRFRLQSSDGSSYIRTTTVQGVWQKSHFHRHVQETYIVQNGAMALVERSDNRDIVTILKPNSSVVTTKPNVPHNVYLYPNSVIHTIKHGSATGDEDWIAYPPLDETTLKWTEADIEFEARKCRPQ
ncbi:MAG: hypothetical protein F9K32_20515 [Desulfobulbaceae bacterium]|nr:MAG: hypothetical protein F9K32_20515 [Desulfobulbaceae bacterium]